MKNEIITKETTLPSKLKDVTLQQLVNQCDEFAVKGKTLKMRKATEEGIMTLTFDSYANGSIVTKSNFENLDTKKDYTQSVKQMYEAGMSQKDIAFALGISQSYVSKLLK